MRRTLLWQSRQASKAALPLIRCCRRSLVQAHERGESPLAEAVELLPKEVDLIRVFFGGVHDLAAQLELAELAHRRRGLRFVDVDFESTADDGALLALLGHDRPALPASRGRPQAPDVLALHDVLLQLPE